MSLQLLSQSGRNREGWLFNYPCRMGVPQHDEYSTCPRYTKIENSLISDNLNHSFMFTVLAGHVGYILHKKWELTSESQHCNEFEKQEA